VKSLTDPIGLRTLRLGARMVDVLQGQVQLVVVMLGITAVFCAPDRSAFLAEILVFFEEWQDPVIEQIGGGHRRLAIIELGKDYLGCRYR